MKNSNVSMYSSPVVYLIDYGIGRSVLCNSTSYSIEPYVIEEGTDF